MFSQHLILKLLFKLRFPSHIPYLYSLVDLNEHMIPYQMLTLIADILHPTVDVLLTIRNRRFIKSYCLDR